MKVERLIAIDFARAICIVLVVIGHFVPENSPEWYLVFRQWIYSFHMPVFFFISGYLYTLQSVHTSDYLSFIRKKALRLLVPYLIISLLLIGLKLVIQSETAIQSPVTLSSFFRLFYYPEAGYFLWFVWSLYIIFLIIPFFKTQKSKLFLFFLSFIIHYLLVLSGNSGLENHYLTDLFCIDKTAVMLLWFMVGVISVEIKKRLKITTSWRLFSVLAFLSVSIWFCFNPAFNEQTIPAAVLPYLGILGIFAITGYLSKHGRYVSPLFFSLSRASFFIYLLHTTFLGIAKTVYEKIAFFSSLPFIIELLLVVSVGVFIPLALYSIIVYLCPSFKKYI